MSRLLSLPQVVALLADFPDPEALAEAMAEGPARIHIQELRRLQIEMGGLSLVETGEEWLATGRYDVDAFVESRELPGRRVAGLIACLIRHVQELRAKKPARALEVARAAVDAAERLEAEPEPEMPAGFASDDPGLAPLFALAAQRPKLREATDADAEAARPSRVVPFTYSLGVRSQLRFRARAHLAECERLAGHLEASEEILLEVLSELAQLSTPEGKVREIQDELMELALRLEADKSRRQRPTWDLHSVPGVIRHLEESESAGFDPVRRLLELMQQDEDEEAARHAFEVAELVAETGGLEVREAYEELDSAEEAWQRHSGEVPSLDELEAPVGLGVLLLRRAIELRKGGSTLRALETARKAESLLCELPGSERRLAERCLDEANRGALGRTWIYPEHTALLCLARNRAHIANFHRIHGELDEADRWFRKALEAISAAPFESSTGAFARRWAWAELLGLRASLLAERNEFEKAVGLCDSALEIYRADGAQARVARILVQIGHVRHQSGDVESAAEFFRAAITINACERDVLSSARFNLARSLFESGRRQESAELLRTVPPFKKPAFEARRVWLLGVGAEEAGNLQEAEGLLKVARRLFFLGQVPLGCARVTIDLAGVLLEQGRLDEVEFLAAELVEYFSKQQLPADALAAVAVFIDAAKSRALTQTMLQEVAHQLRFRA